MTSDDISLSSEKPHFMYTSSVARLEDRKKGNARKVGRTWQDEGDLNEALSDPSKKEALHGPYL